MTPSAALAQLEAMGNPQKASEMAAYHKVARRYLGLSNVEVDALAKSWRAEIDLETRLALAQGLWESDIFEGRIAAAKLMTQARIRPDDTQAWEMIVSWVPAFDSWAIADAVSSAGGRRLVIDPRRLDTVETWTKSDHLWTRRAALVMTLPWTKQVHPKREELAQRERILGWAASYVPDTSWFIQKAIAWWLRELSKRDSRRVLRFLEAHGAMMQKFARNEAVRLISAKK